MEGLVGVGAGREATLSLSQDFLLFSFKPFPSECCYPPRFPKSGDLLFRFSLLPLKLLFIMGEGCEPGDAVALGGSGTGKELSPGLNQKSSCNDEAVQGICFPAVS